MLAGQRQHRQRASIGAAVLGGGVAVFPVQRLAGLEHGHGLFQAQGGHQFGQGEVVRGFLHHPIGLLRAGFAADHPAFRIGGGGIDAGQLQRLAVVGAQMAGLVHQDHRNIRGDGIQFLAVGVTAFGQLRIVIAEADQHRVTTGCGGAGEELTHDPLQVRDRIALAIGRWQQVGRQCLQAGTGNMAVGIDEPRCQGVPLQVDHAGLRAELHRRLAAADKCNAAIAHHHRLGLRLGLVDRDHRAASVQGVGCVGGRGDQQGQQRGSQQRLHDRCPQ